MKKNILCFTLLMYLMQNSTGIHAHEIALTIDDLPFVGVNSRDENNINGSGDKFGRILQSLIDNQIPATGFIIAGAIGKNQWQLLEEFRKEGFGLGNHTYTHANLNQLSAIKYINEISRADKILAPIMTQPKYFRYPYLAEGKGETKQVVQDYLTANQYIIAPVTIDSKDYRFNARLLHIPSRLRPQYLDKLKKEYLDYIWTQTLLAEKRVRNKQAKQILLIHANLLNSYFLNDVIQMYKNNGYKFISLTEAITNAAVPEQTNNAIQTIPEQTNNAIQTIPDQTDKKTLENNYIQNTEWLTTYEKVW